MKNLITRMTLSVLSLSIALQVQTAQADRGNVVAAAIGGVIVGGLIGSSVAQNFNEDDNRQSQRVFNRALSRDYSDSPYAWEGSGHRGRIIFTGEGYFDGLYCRIYRSEVWDGRSNSPMVTTGLMCRAQDGSWFRREGEVGNSRRGQPDRGRQFDPPPQQQMGQQQMGQPAGMPGRQQGGNFGFGSPGANYGQNGGGRPNGGGNFNTSTNTNTSTSSGTVITNGDALPIGVQ